MSNSSLVTHTKISPHKNSPRNHKIDTITIHCVCGQCSVEALGEEFYKKSKKASSNYGIGYDGKIGMYVEEKDRSWCSSNAANDHRAITIEVASDIKPPYAVTDAAYKALIELLVDICKRNDIKELKWKADKSLIGKPEEQNMTVHRWFANKDCPGEYLYSRHGAIAEAVNKKLNPAKEQVFYYVQTGSFRNKEYADAEHNKLVKAGFDAHMVKASGLYKTLVGKCTNKGLATVLANKVKAAGFSSFITTQSGTAVSVSKTKTVNELAQEVLDGKWGNGSDRRKRLTKAGYDYDAVQDKVNEICKKKAVKK